jgi:hypothetical protein
MYKMLIVVPFTALMLSACIVSPDHHSRGVVVAPALPVVVELDVEPYYYQSGYYYYYDNDNWRYSNTKNGPWTNLPRSHYPRETRFKGHSGDRGRGNGRDNDRDHDNRDGR